MTLKIQFIRIKIDLNQYKQKSKFNTEKQIWVYAAVGKNLTEYY